MSLPVSRPALVRRSDGEVWLADPGGPAGTILKALRAGRVGSLDRVVVTGMARARWGGLERLAREVPIRRLELPAPLALRPRLRPILRDLAGKGTEIRLTRPSSGPWTLLFGPIGLELGGPGGPRVTRGEAEYSTIATRLKSGALLVSIYGSTATLLRAK